MAEEKKPLPKGVLSRLEFEAKRSAIEPIYEQHICRLDLHRNYMELVISYNFLSVSTDDNGCKVEADDVVRMHDLVPRDQLAIQRTLYSQQHEPIPEGQTVPNLHHAIILRYQGLQFWIYTTQKDADYLFKEIKAWLLS